MKALRIMIIGCLAAAAIWAADVSGKWTAEMQGRNGNTMTVNMNLKADGDKLTGTVSGRGGDTDITDGKVEGDNISFKVVREFNGNQMTSVYKGKVDGDTIHFSMAMEGGQGGGQPRTFDAKRAGGM
jgi:autotransporter translocation and assembly factor TamB